MTRYQGARRRRGTCRRIGQVATVLVAGGAGGFTGVTGTALILLT